MKNRVVCRISGVMKFPEGLAVGEDRFSNVCSIARNGEGTPVLRGTSLCGALRSAFVEECSSREDYWFGAKFDKGQTQSQDSRIIVADAVLSSMKSEIRTHNMINRHTGSVVDKGLFAVEMLPPDTCGKLLLYVFAESSEEANQCLDIFKKILGSGLSLGGNRNRGIGRLECESLKLQRFNLEDKDEYSNWMDIRYADRVNTAVVGGEDFCVNQSNAALSIDVLFGIPRGEDLMVSYGSTLDGLQGEPQYVIKTDGKKYWRIPGATFRGIFRAWMSRLAVLDGETLKYQEKNFKPDLVGWAGEKAGEQRSLYQSSPKELEDPILDLFGSLYKRGRIHFSDAYSVEPAKEADLQLRRHVAIDRFSGGANDGMLFSNKVLLSGISFKMNITLKQGSGKEKKWLLKTLRAIDMGIVSFGSSKASGLLSVKNLEETTSLLEG